MQNLSLTEKDKMVIESIIEKLAKENNIDNVISVDLDLNKTSGFIKFRTKESFIPGVTALLPFLMPAVALLGSDPEIGGLISKIVDAEIAKGTLAGKDKDKYISMIKDIVTSGADKVISDIKATEKNSGGQTTPAPAVTAPVAPSPTQTKVTSYSDLREKLAAGEDIALDTDPTAAPAVGVTPGKAKGAISSISQWGSNIANNVANSLKNFFGDVSSTELVNQLVDAVVKKGTIPAQYKDQFTKYLNEFIQAGFQKVDEDIATQKEEEAKNGENADDDEDINLDGGATEDGAAAAAKRGKGNYAQGTPISIRVSENGQFSKLEPAVMEGVLDQPGQRVQVWFSSLGQVDQNIAKQWVPYGSIVDQNNQPYQIQEMGQNSGNEDFDIGAVKASSQTFQQKMQEQANAEQHQPPTPEPEKNPPPSAEAAKEYQASLFEDRVKSASYYMEQILDKDPLLYEMMESFMIKNGFDASEEQRFAGFNEWINNFEKILNTAEQVIGLTKRTSHPDVTDAIDAATKLFKVKSKGLHSILDTLGIKNPKKFTDKAQDIIEFLSKSLKNVHHVLEGDEEAIKEEPSKEEAYEEKEEAATESKVPYTEIYTDIPRQEEEPLNEKLEKYFKESDYTKLNSGSFLLKKGSTFYNEIETIIEKTANENGIDGISEIEIAVTKEGCEVSFHKKAELNLLAAGASALAGRFLGKDESMLATGAKALEASIGGFGATAGQIVGKFFGLGTMGQLIAGAAGAALFYLFSNKDTPTGQAAGKELSSNISGDATLQKIKDSLKEKFPNIPEYELDMHASDLFSKFLKH